MQALHDKMFKTTAGRKEKKLLKTVGYITPAMDYHPGMDRWEILIPALTCNDNQSNEQYITLIQGCMTIKSQHPIRKVVLRPEPQHPWFKTTKHTRTEEPLNKIPTLESSDMLQN